MLENCPLGRASVYTPYYYNNQELLFAVPRHIQRSALALDNTNLPFYGHDVWNAYELSWLGTSGKPEVRILECIYPAESQFMLESKSFKLYLNAFHNTRFPSEAAVLSTLTQDLTHLLQTSVAIKIKPITARQDLVSGDGISLDNLDLSCEEFLVNPEYLEASDEYVEEILHSHLLKSNCLITNQPDFGSVQITYSGRKINHAGLLKYIVSFRDHKEFHEQCVERIFIDIMKRCTPEKLTVYARYTRRGGIDINPFRTTEKLYNITNARWSRQ